MYVRTEGSGNAGRTQSDECPDLLNMLQRTSINDAQESTTSVKDTLPDVVLELPKNCAVDENLNVVLNEDDDAELEMIYDSCSAASTSRVTLSEAQSESALTTCSSSYRGTALLVGAAEFHGAEISGINTDRHTRVKRSITCISQSCPLSLLKGSDHSLCRGAIQLPMVNKTTCESLESDSVPSDPSVSVFPTICDEEICSLLDSCQNSSGCSCEVAVSRLTGLGCLAAAAVAGCPPAASGPRACKRIKLHNRPFLDFEKMQRQKASFRRSSGTSRSKLIKQNSLVPVGLTPEQRSRFTPPPPPSEPWKVESLEPSLLFGFRSLCTTSQ